MSIFFRSFHLLHLLQQFQADCVCNKILFRCLFLIVTVYFISFPFISTVSVVSREDVHFFFARFICYTCYSSFRQIVSVIKFSLDACFLLLRSISLVFH